jgi:glycosyltransferase involved in cell wall biosynthesis
MARPRRNGGSWRVLYVLSGLELGGVETWLLDLVRRFRSTAGAGIECDFLTLLHEGGRYEPVLGALGCRVHHVRLGYSRLPIVVARMARLMKRGEYDVVHCQGDYVSGLVMLAARLAGIPRRVFHVHNTRFAFGPGAALGRRLAGKLLRQAAVRFSDAALCCSGDAKRAFFEGNGPRSAQVLYSGIDTSAFPADEAECRGSVRAELGLPPGTLLLLFVGRLAEEKNPGMLIDVMCSMSKRERTRLLLVGDGPARPRLEGEIAARGLGHSCLLLGFRTDVPRLMVAADVFVLPSRYEGLPLALIHAQAAGLPIVASDVITREAVVVPELFRWVSPCDPPERWAAAVAEALETGRRISVRDALDAVCRSPFEISNSAGALLRAYGFEPTVSRPDETGADPVREAERDRTATGAKP